MRIVIDANVWVSRLLLAGSPSARAVDKALEGHEVMVSEALMEELATVLGRRKSDRYVSLEDRQAFMRREKTWTGQTRRGGPTSRWPISLDA